MVPCLACRVDDPQPRERAQVPRLGTLRGGLQRVQYSNLSMPPTVGGPSGMHQFVGTLTSIRGDGWTAE